jgi:ankyrin repeat protein
MTALHVACFYGQSSIVKLLLDAGAKTSIKMIPSGGRSWQKKSIPVYRLASLCIDEQKRKEVIDILLEKKAPLGGGVSNVFIFV